MNRLTKTLAAALALAAIAGGGLTLAAFRRSHDPAQLEEHVNRRVTKMLDDLQATDAQRQQILAIKDRLLADGKALHQGQKDAHGQLLAQWNADQPDAAAVHQLVDARADAMKKFADEVADAMLQVHGILTPEQRAKLAQHLQQHHQQHPAAR